MKQNTTFLQARRRLLGWVLRIIVSFMAFTPKAGFALDQSPLSLEDCLSLADEHAPELKKARLFATQGEAASQEAALRSAPQFSLQGAYDVSDDVNSQLPDANRAELHAEIPDPFLGPERYERQRLKALAKAADNSRQATAELVKDSVRNAYFQILRGSDELEAYEQVRAQVAGLLISVIPRFQMGGGPGFDTVKVRSALNDLDRARDQSSLSLEDSRREMMRLLDLGDTQPLSLKPLASLPALPSEVTTGGPALDALKAEAEAAQASLSAAEAARLPALSLYGDYGYSGQAWESMSLGWGLGLGVNLPIWDWGASSHEAEQASLDLNQSLLDLADQTRQWDGRLAHVRAEAQTLLEDHQRQMELLPDLKRTALAAAQSYRRGGLGVIEATDALNLWLETLLQERDDFFGYLSLLSEMQRLSGGSLEVSYGQ
jgi:outer membrane protein TolC